MHIKKKKMSTDVYSNVFNDAAKTSLSEVTGLELNNFFLIVKGTGSLKKLRYCLLL